MEDVAEVQKKAQSVGELVEQSFLAGYRHGVESFSVWKSGQQVVGVMQRPMREVFKTAKEDCMDAYRYFLDRQRAGCSDAE